MADSAKEAEEEAERQRQHKLEEAAKHLRRIELERATKDGKAAVRMAALIYDPDDMARVAECRQWLKFSLDCDKTEADRALLKGDRKRSKGQSKRAGVIGRIGKRPLGVVSGASS